MENYKHIVGLLSCALVVSGGMMLTGCTDDNYDLGSLDKTIAIGSDAGLALPGNNSTREIVLDDLLDIDDSDVISTDANGNYLFTKDDDGGVTEANPQVDVVTIKQEQTKDFSVDIAGLNIPVEFPTLPGIPVETIIGYAVDAAWGQIPNEINAGDTISMFELGTSHDATIVNLTKVQTSTSGTKSSIDIELAFSQGLRTLLQEVEEIVIDMPLLKYLGTSVKATRGNIELDKANRQLLLKNVPTTGTKLTLTIEELSGFEKQKNNEDNYLVFTSDSILLKGVVNLAITLKKEDLSKDGLKTLLTSLYYNGVTPAYSIGASTTIHDIEITAAEGMFQPDATEAEGKVAITSIPDFLNDDEVRIKLDNPQLYLDVSSNMNVRAQIKDIVISAINTAKDGKPRTVRKVVIDNIDLLPCTNEDGEPVVSHIVICDNEHGLDAGYTPVFTNQSTNTLQNLISTIPDSITFECNATADPTYQSSIALGKRYTIKPSYRFKAPLTLNTGSQIVYTDSINGWNDDLDDIQLTNGASITLMANATNGVPVDLNLNAVAIDVNGKELSSELISIEIVKGVVKGATANSGNLQPQKSDIEIVITQRSQEAFKQLDGIRYRAEAISNVDGITLNSETQTLKIEGITINLKGKVIKDLDD